MEVMDLTTRVEVVGNGLGPRGSAEVWIKRAFPELEGANFRAVEELFYEKRREIYDNPILYVRVVNDQMIEPGKTIPVFIGTYDPKYKDVNKPTTEFPDPVKMMEEFNTLADYAEKYLKISITAKKVYDIWETSVQAGNSILVKYLGPDKWEITVRGNIYSLPSEEVRTGMIVYRTNAEVTKTYTDAQIENFSEDDMELLKVELLVKIRLMVIYNDVEERFTVLTKELKEKAILSNSLHYKIVPGKLIIYPFNMEDKARIIKYEEPRDAIPIVNKLTSDDLLHMAKEWGVVERMREYTPPELAEEMEQKRKRDIIKQRHRTEVYFEDFVMALKLEAAKH